MVNIQIDLLLFHLAAHVVMCKPRWHRWASGQSNSTSRHAFRVPALPAQQCRFTVDQVVISVLRNQILVSHDVLG